MAKNDPPVTIKVDQVLQVLEAGTDRRGKHFVTFLADDGSSKKLLIEKDDVRKAGSLIYERVHISITIQQIPEESDEVKGSA